MKSLNESIWTKINTIPQTYPWLYQNEYTSLCIVGGDFSAALCALKSATLGVETVLISPCPIGYDTGILSNCVVKSDLFDGFAELSSKIGSEHAKDVYKKLKSSSEKIKKLANFLGIKNLKELSTLYYAESEDAAYNLRKEYLARVHNNIDSTQIQPFFDPLYGLNPEFSFLSINSATSIDPFIFIHSILKKAQENGARIYENTNLFKIKSGKNAPILLTTTGKSIQAQKLILSMEQIKPLCPIHIRSRSRKFFTAVNLSENQKNNNFRDLLFSKFDYPSLEIAPTTNNNILVSGLDSWVAKEDFSHLTARKYETLKKEFSKINNTKDISIDFSFYKDFIATSNGLPLIMRHKHYPECYFYDCPPDNNMVLSEIISESLMKLYDK